MPKTVKTQMATAARQRKVELLMTRGLTVTQIAATPHPFYDDGRRLGAVKTINADMVAIRGRWITNDPGYLPRASMAIYMAQYTYADCMGELDKVLQRENAKDKDADPKTLISAITAKAKVQEMLLDATISKTPKEVINAAVSKYLHDVKQGDAKPALEP